MYRLNRTLRRMMFRIPQPARMIIVATSGLIIVLLGLILLPLPGPGSLIILFGLMVLAIEFAWARRCFRRGRVTVFRTWQRTPALAVQSVHIKAKP